MPGDIFDSSDTLLYNQSLIVYTPNNSFTRELMEGVEGHPAFSVRQIRGIGIEQSIAFKKSTTYVSGRSKWILTSLLETTILTAGYASYMSFQLYLAKPARNF